MRKEGYPIESLTIAAGIPSLEAAKTIMGQLNDVGIKKIGFKPGTIFRFLEKTKLSNEEWVP